MASFASAAELFEVGFNHFFRGKEDGAGDQIFFQGHSAPGVYARAFLEGRLTEANLDAFRQESKPDGLSSYPHPRLMPEFWEFPTVSMGLGPLNAIYQARFNQYLKNRELVDTSGSRVWAFVGDGEMDEPEAQGALTVAGRERLDNLTFVLNCNLQRLDGPVRGNGKIIQEMEALFRGAGWNVVKVVWGRLWDDLLAADETGELVAKLNATPDGQFQTLAAESAGLHPRAPLRHQGAAAVHRRHVRRRAGRPGHRPRRPRPAQGACRLPGRARPPGPADGDPGPDHQGPRAGPRVRVPQRHPPDEEVRPRHPQHLPGPPGHRRPRRGAGEGIPALLPASRGLRPAQVPAGAPPRPRRAGTDPGRPLGPAGAARQGAVRPAQEGLGQAGGRHHHGPGPADQGPAAQQGRRPADRAHHPRRGPHLRHGLVLPQPQDLLVPGHELRRRRPRPGALLQGGHQGPDPP